MPALFAHKRGESLDPVQLEEKRKKRNDALLLPQRINEGNL